MIQNDTFKFVVHRENFLSVSQCQKLMRYLETGEPTESELAGNYDDNILNKEVAEMLARMITAVDGCAVTTLKVDISTPLYDAVFENMFEGTGGGGKEPPEKLIPKVLGICSSAHPL